VPVFLDIPRKLQGLLRIVNGMSIDKISKDAFCGREKIHGAQAQQTLTRGRHRQATAFHGFIVAKCILEFIITDQIGHELQLLNFAFNNGCGFVFVDAGPVIIQLLHDLRFYIP
jgi:hypothetical protein